MRVTSKQTQLQRHQVIKQLPILILEEIGT